MPSYAHLDKDRFTFYGTDGRLYELRGLPINRRDLFVVKWAEWIAVLDDVTDFSDFIQKYDLLLADGSPNPYYDNEFCKLTNWLLSYLIVFDPIDATKIRLIDVVDAETVVGLLISHEGSPSVVEQLEFPKPKEKPSKPLPEGVDSMAHIKAALATHVNGDLQQVEALCDSVPANELMAILEETNRLLKISKDGDDSKADKPTTNDEALTELGLIGQSVGQQTPDEAFSSDMRRVMDLMQAQAARER